MKPFTLIAAMLFSVLSAQGATTSLEDVSPHFSPETRIVWKVPINSVPAKLWVYKKTPQVFSPVVVSNALAIGGFQLKHFPKSFVKPITLWDKEAKGDPQPDYFVLTPDSGTIMCRRERHPVGSGALTPDALVNRTWQYAARLGIDQSLLVYRTNSAKGSTVSLCRRIDGIEFRDDSEGFSAQYGSQGEIRDFSLIWPTLKPHLQSHVISPDEIIRCIRAFKTPVLPKEDEPDYFARIKSLANVKTLTITKITPYYSEGKYGEQSDGQKLSPFIYPVAVLEAVADWGATNASLQIFSPLLPEHK